MKRYLTVGIIFSILVVTLAVISWVVFPAWHNPASGGFWALAGVAAVAAWTFVKDAVSVWKDLKDEPKAATPVPLQSVQSQQADSILNAPGGTINYYPPQINIRPEPSPETPKTWNLKHPYGLPKDFTGRVDERKMLTDWLENDHEEPLFVLRALGGFGKSALSWYWLLHDVEKAKWTRVLWWSFYEGDASFDAFIREAYEYLIDKENVPNNPRLLVEQVLKELEKPNILLVMDGFERALRAFGNMGAAYQEDGGKKVENGKDLDCISPAAEEFLKKLASLGRVIQSKVLMTTRLTPRVLFTGANHDAPLQGMVEKELFQMMPADAVKFFHKQGIHGTHTEIEAACAPYGFHPLSLRLLAGLIVKDKRQPGDISCANRYADKVSREQIQRQHHVLEQAYEALSPVLQTLLSNLACFRSSITYDAVVAIAQAPKDSGVLKLFKNQNNSSITNLDDALDELIVRGFLHQTTQFTDSQSPITAFDLHPIVRRYAYDRLTAADRAGAHGRLVNYFEAVPKPEKVKTLEDLAPVIELYHHMVGAGNLDEARVLFRDRLNQATYYQFGAYQLRIELMSALFLDGEDEPPRLKDEVAQAWTLNGLGNTYSASGQPRYAVPLFEQAIKLGEAKGDKKNLAIRLGNVAYSVQLLIGKLKESESNLHRCILLFSEIHDEFREAAHYQEFGRVLSYRGAWQEAEQELDKAISIKVWKENPQGYGVNFAYRALRFLLMARSNPQSQIENLKSSIECAQRALELADKFSQTDFRVERDYVRAHWLLGAAYRSSAALRSAQNEPNNELTLAEENLSKALNLCRQINLVEMEADILLDVARLSFAYALREAPGSAQDKLFEEAKSRAEEALVITERCGYVLQGADVNNFLAELALAWEEKGIGSRESGAWGGKEMARKYAEEALRLATCDGPPYYYKVAYEEAERMLEKLK